MEKVWYPGNLVTGTEQETSGMVGTVWEGCSTTPSPLLGRENPVTGTVKHFFHIRSDDYINS